MDEMLYRGSYSFSLASDGVPVKFRLTIRKRPFYRGLASFVLATADGEVYKEP
ncbi:hypothetical protein AB0K00_33845 [Dactylosporangium sp. NPDC049525]|uniref:hypothetical protein n=1 Tax=Dactylosporangium sp. NPDC049525 TaxID=3154730 RepID=UPI0034167838